ncbi:hypothetical protein ABC977_11875 [Thioalkalicoccus limnaeus]|uniref:Transmembrane protein n=1 Tax=Thioalkalicoccus limnaeus TaxID=120681 RepID=A0ABV4BHZ9_9GAMM
MDDFSIGLALFNFLPILFWAAAFVALAHLVGLGAPGHIWLVWVGGGLVVLGGLTKATWKLIVAVSGPDLVWLSNALFPLLGAGFVLLAAGVWGGLRGLAGRMPGPSLWLAPTVLIIAALAAAAWRTWGLEITRGWFLPLMMLTSLGNLGLSLLLIATTLRRRLWLAATLFIANVAMIFALQPIAVMEPKTVAVHWLEQSLTALGTAGFALAAWLLYRAARGSGTATRDA